MKSSSVRVALFFAKMPKDQLNSFAILAIVCLKTNPLFPNLPVTLAALTALQAAYQDAITSSAMGDPKDSAVLRECRQSLLSALRQIASYIQSLNLTESQVLTSGYDVIVWSRNPITLVAPSDLALDNSISGQLGVSFLAVAGAKAYQVQYCAGAGAWVDAGIWPNTRGIIVLNLTPGTVYAVRARGVGGSAQYGPWSSPVSLMCT